VRAIWSGDDVGDSAAASASCSLLSTWSNGIAIEGLTDTVGMRPVYLKLKSQEVLPGQVPICGVRGEVLACTLHGRLYWLLLCRPAPEFVIAVRVVHGVPMIWSDRGNRQTNQKMVWSDNWISGLWLNPYPVVHCSAEPLFAAKIFFSSLHGHMPQ